MLTATKQIAHGLFRRVFLVNTTILSVEPMIPKTNRIGPPIRNKYVAAEYNVDEDMRKKRNERDFQTLSFLYDVTTISIDVIIEWNTDGIRSIVRRGDFCLT